MSRPEHIGNCANTGSMIFTTPAEVKETREKLAEAESRNAQLEEMLAVLVAAQPKSVRDKLPKNMTEHLSQK